MKLTSCLTLLSLCTLLGTLIAAEKSEGPLNFKMKNITGEEVDLSKYKGKVVMIVNVASQCGLTKQYKELEALHEKYGKEGLVILGFPANEFGKQEPGSNETIATFCKSKFGVKFDMFEKVVVKGEGQCPLYQYLTNHKAEYITKEGNKSDFSGDITWNFEKFIIGRDGQVVVRVAPRVVPDDPKVLTVIEKQLNTKAVAAR